MADRNNPFFNNSGYPDPTAYKALKPIIQADTALQHRVNRLICELKTSISDSGFELLNRIEIRDRETGRIFK